MAFRIRWPTRLGGITQRFGENANIYRKFGLPGHEGVDFAAPHSTPIYAVREGLVSDVRLDGFSDPMVKPYGNQVRIEHPEGYETIYAHLSRVVVVRGQYVQAKQLIGLSGDTGYSSRAHLHLSLKKHGATVNGETTYPYDLIDPEVFLVSFLEDKTEEPQLPNPAVAVRVESPEIGFLNIRALPTTESDILLQVDHGAELGALEPPLVVAHKVGVGDQWLWITTPDGRAGWVAAWYLASPVGLTSPDAPPSTETDRGIPVRVDSQGENLLIRTGPGVEYEEITRVPDGTLLTALEAEEAVKAKVGRKDVWLHVKAPTEEVGYCAAWFVVLADGALRDAPPPKEAPRAIFIIVDSQGENLKLRDGPGTEYEVLTKLPDGTQLKALEDLAAVEAKVGERGEWLRVQAPTGQIGYCAAWFLKLKPFGDKPVIPEPPGVVPATYVVVESPDVGLRLRAGPGTHHDRIWWMPHKTVLTSLEDPMDTGAKLGKHGEWIHVRTPSHFEGYAAAWFLRHPTGPDTRTPVEAGDVPTGTSSHIFGIHALSVADDPISREHLRGLHYGTGKQGWVLFTEICGRHAHTINMIPEIRRWLWDWADAGYGVIIRLNHGYDPGGTLPESRFYDDYAAAAARWVEIYLKDAARSPASYTWTIQIGNEQNNPREHPGGFEHPVEHITPELYADAFNRTYARIKAILPNAVVCPGAVDPYNYQAMRCLGGVRWRPLDYFSTMMAHIRDLDGVILHAYTHGPDPEAITHLKRFGDGSGPLGDHYYDFQTYRQFMERIPARWRNLPVYVTEMDHIHRPSGEHDQGWINRNLGWIQAAYAELNRWNEQPYAQQIHCGLVYRWMGDVWSIADKHQVLEDYKQALTQDFRWRAEPAEGPLTFGAKAGTTRAEPKELEERFLMYPDDLTRLKGIGEKAQSALRAAGIMLYQQLARMAPSDLELLLEETGLRTSYLYSWPEQASLAAAGAWDRLNELWDQLS